VGRGINHAFPVFLPDGKHFLYLLMSGPQAGWGLFLGSLDKKPQEQSTQMLVSTPFSAAYRPSAEAGSGQLLFLRENTLLGQAFDEKGLRLQGEPVPLAERVGGGGSYGFFSASQNGSLVYIHGTEGNLQLTWYDRKGQVAGAPGEPGHFSNVKVSPDGTKAIVARTDGANTDLWLVDLMRGSNIRFTFDPAPDGGPVWSPDGSRVAWNSNRGGNVGIYVKSTNGSGTEELLYNAGPQPLQTTDWTRDGKFILYQQSIAPFNRDIWALPVGEDTTADRKPIPVVQTPADESGGFVSPDNKWLSYISTE
jgi:dipeptidyl aminopeptidase/acylaminoacyl peptidase